MNGFEWETPCGFDAAKAGTTYAEYATWSDSMGPKYADRYIYLIFLPDNPDIAGEQSLTLVAGNTSHTIHFTLDYLGDYENGMGWKMKNLSY